MFFICFFTQVNFKEFTHIYFERFGDLYNFINFGLRITILIIMPGNSCNAGDRCDLVLGKLPLLS